MRKRVLIPLAALNGEITMTVEDACVDRSVWKARYLYFKATLSTGVDLEEVLDVKNSS